MKKILHIAEAFGSGVLNYIKNLALWQCREYKVYIAYGVRPETPENFKEQFDKSIIFIEVNGFTRGINFVSDLKAFHHIRKIVKEIQPELIHLHSSKAGVIGRWGINCNRYCVLYSPHAYSFLMQDCSDRKRKLYWILEKISDRKNCLTIANMDGELKKCKEITKHAICIPSGINPNEMNAIMEEAQRYREPPKNIRVCALGKIVPQKNPRLFNEVAGEFPDIEFLWIGEGELRNELSSPNISITGWLTRPEAVAKVMDSDIFLFPSSWESMSIALLEVMYIGKPCIVSPADGNKDVIKDGKNGFVCTTKEEYVTALKKLLKNEKMRLHFSKEVHKDILDKYNVDVMEKQYRNLLKKLFDQRKQIALADIMEK